MEAPQNKRFYGKMKCLTFWPTYKGEKGKKNHVYKNQGWEPIHQKVNDSMNRHNPKKKTKTNNQQKNKEKITVYK
jgi:hypothetical protein